MKITERCNFPVAPATLMQMYGDPAFYPAKYQRLGAREIRVLECVDEAPRFSIRVSREVPAELPAFARKFVAPMAAIVQTDRWDRKTLRGDVEVQVKGLPAKIGIVQRLEKAPGGAVKIMDWTVEVAIPLIGGKLEKALLEQMLKELQRDTEVSLELLEKY